MKYLCVVWSLYMRSYRSFPQWTFRHRVSWAFRLALIKESDARAAARSKGWL
jgi:hypothetical protein